MIWLCLSTFDGVSLEKATGVGDASPWENGGKTLVSFAAGGVMGHLTEKLSQMIVKNDEFYRMVDSSFF